MESQSTDNIFGAYLSELRKLAGFTQKQLAAILHISESSLAHYEQGRAFPDIQTLIQLADYFKVNIDYLLGRCQCKIKYNDLNEIFSSDMSYSQLINIIATLPKRKKHYLYETIKILTESDN